MERGIALSRQYGVDRLLQPIFDYVPTRDSPPPAPKHITAAPTRPRKSNKDGLPTPLDAAASAKATKAANTAAQQARRREVAAQAQAEVARRRAEEAGSGEYDMLEDEFGAAEEGQGRAASPTASEGSEASQTPSPLGSEAGDTPGGGTRKRKHDELTPGGSGLNHFGPAGPLRYARMILDYFVSESTQVPHFLVQPPADFDANVVIDDDGHTALHWACAMGRIRIVRLLLTAGADIFRANSMGQTALMRSVMFTNNYDLRKFADLFELLHRSTINIDRNDRTVFHYIVDIALQKGKTHAARYYIETVLDRLRGYPKEVADILNFQDEEGETALTLAARARSKRLVKILLDNGADPKIANRDGKNAEDYILEDERFRQAETVATYPGGVQPPQQPGTAIPLAGSGASPVYAGKLFNSQAATRAAREVAREAAELVDSLAESFEFELVGQQRDLAQANETLRNFRTEIDDSRAQIAAIEGQAGEVTALEAREAELELGLGDKLNKRFRLGWEKWVRDEDARQHDYEAGLQAAADAGAPVPEAQADLDVYLRLAGLADAEGTPLAGEIRARLAGMQEEREALFGRFVGLRKEAGTGRRMQQYKQLIALGCGVPLEGVEGVIGGLCETLEGAEEVAC